MEAGGGLTFGGVEFFAAGQFDAEVECFQCASAAFELVDRQAVVGGEGGQGCADVAAGGRFGVVGVGGADPQERLGGDAVACEGGPAAFGVSDDPFAQGQPVAAAVPGRDTGVCARGDR
ncbi:hypothetical protein C6Y44_26770 (plasmid) [Rhodococcus rhodochrous]|nr:hypothetical protein C6Y44_26770 [Rhodococcus rhodochrous]